MMRTALLMLFIVSLVFCAEGYGEVLFPWQSWGKLSYSPGPEVMSETGLKLDAYLEQGIELFGIGAWKVMPFGALRLTFSSRPDVEWWNNNVGPMMGIMFINRTLSPISNGWGTLSFGVAFKEFLYIGGAHPQDGREERKVDLFLQWTTGGYWGKSK